MRFNVTVRTDGIEALRRRISHVKEAPKEALRFMGEKAVRDTQRRITSSKTSPDGQPWQPWSMATQRQYAQSGRGGSLLYRTGALNNSIQYRLSEHTLTVYSNVGYAKYHQFGTSKMPARPFMGWVSEDINTLKQILVKGIV